MRPTRLAAAAALLAAACGAPQVPADNGAGESIGASVASLEAPWAPPPAARAADDTPEAPFPARSGRVVDEAGLLSDEEERRLVAQLTMLEGQSGDDEMVIVTVRSLGGVDIDEYSRALGNRWGIGQYGRGGVLIVVAPAERRTRIAVSRGLEAILTSDRSEEIVARDLVPNFSQGRWAAGLESGTRAIAATLAAQAEDGR